MSKIKNGGLDQYGAEPHKQQQLEKVALKGIISHGCFQNAFKRGGVVVACRISCCHLPFQSKWLYVGTERGNVHVVSLESFTLSGYVINWNKAIEL